MLLVLAFGRTRDALIVMANLPLALIGGVAGVFLVRPRFAMPIGAIDDLLAQLRVSLR